MRPSQPSLPTQPGKMSSPAPKTISVPKPSPKPTFLPGAAIDLAPKTSPAKTSMGPSPAKSTPTKPLEKSGSFNKGQISPKILTSSQTGVPKDSKSILERASTLTTSSIESLNEIKDISEKKRDIYAEENAKILKENKELKAKLENESKIHRKEKSAIQNELLEKNGMIDDLNKELEALKNLQKGGKSPVSPAKSAEVESQKIKELTQQNAKLIKELKDLEAKNIMQTQDIQTQLNEKMEIIKKLEKDLSNLKSAENKPEIHIPNVSEKYKEKIQELQNEIYSVKEKIGPMQKSYEDLMKSMNLEMNQLKENIQEKSQQETNIITKLKKENEILQKQIESLKEKSPDKKEALKAEIIEKASKISELEEKIGNINKNNEETKKKLVELIGKEQSLNKENNEWKLEIEKWRENYGKLKLDKENIENSLNASNKDLQEKIESQKTSFATQISDLNNEIKKIRKFLIILI